MKVLFLIINFTASVGEITNACLFANELIENNVDCYFFNPEGFVKSYLLNYKKIKIVNQNDLGNINFDLLIVSEYFPLFHIACPNVEKEKFEFIKKYFFKKNIPIATIDILGLGSSIKEINENLSLNTSMKNSCSEIIIHNEKKFFSIKPCPINTPPDFKKNNNNFYWQFPKLYSNLETQKKIKEQFGISETDKIIFFPISKWKYLKWKHWYSEKEFFNFGKQIFDLVSTIDFDTNIYLFFGVPNFEIMGYQNKNVSFCFFNPNSQSFIRPDIYENVLSMCDVLLTSYLIQNSFTRAMISGINGINLIDLKNMKVNDSYNIGKFPFQDSNDYAKLFESFEIFDENFLKYLEQLLLNKDLNKSKFENYKQKLNNNCSSAKDICLKIKNS